MEKNRNLWKTYVKNFNFLKIFRFLSMLYLFVIVWIFCQLRFLRKNRNFCFILIIYLLSCYRESLRPILGHGKKTSRKYQIFFQNSSMTQASYEFFLKMSQFRTNSTESLDSLTKIIGFKIILSVNF
jgi:hypothetical protein